MQTHHVFSSAVFGKWKQQARALKRSSELSHHQTLDKVAIANRFENWHHIVNEAKLNLLSETAFRSGLVVAYDIKDATECWRPNDSFVDDWRAMHFCERDIFTFYRQTDDEAEGEERAAIPIDLNEYQEEFNEWLTNVALFRYCAPTLPATPTKVLPLLAERCFFAPMFFWLRGRFIEPWRDLAFDGVLDMSGNTEPPTSGFSSDDGGALDP